MTHDNWTRKADEKQQVKVMLMSCQLLLTCMYHKEKKMMSTKKYWNMQLWYCLGAEKVTLIISLMYLNGSEMPGWMPDIRITSVYLSNCIYFFKYQTGTLVNLVSISSQQQLINLPPVSMSDALSPRKSITNIHSYLYLVIHQTK